MNIVDNMNAYDAAFDRLIGRRYIVNVDSETWTTGNGRRLVIRGMTDDHIVNTLRMIERKTDEAWIRLSEVPANITYAMRMTLDICLNNSQYKALVREATQRKLTWRGDGDQHALARDTNK